MNSCIANEFKRLDDLPVSFELDVQWEYLLADIRILIWILCLEIYFVEIIQDGLKNSANEFQNWIRP